MNTEYSFFATCPKGFESIVEMELADLGAESISQVRAGVKFTGALETGYRACLWLRTANRVLMPITDFPAEDDDELYKGIRNIDWYEHLNPEDTLAVDFVASQSSITHSRYGTQRVKDAIVDQFMERFDIRPSVNLRTPSIRVNAYLFKDHASVSLDLSGESLHKRGYRSQGTEAPLKENLASAILFRADWPEIAEAGGGLVDPMCGSGTIPIEAALMAANSAPGLLREYYGFLGWKQHRPDIWNALLNEAEEREIEGFKKIPPIIGYDENAKAVRAAIECAEKAGLKGLVHFERKELNACLPHPRMKETPGLFIINPPYGVRMGELSSLDHLYAGIGRQLKDHFQQWQASVFTGNPELGKRLGIRAKKKYSLFNGGIPCNLLNFDVAPQWFFRDENDDEARNKNRHLSVKSVKQDNQTEMFINRLRKNLRQLNSWIKKENIRCFRLYDKDIPEFAVCIDIYGQFAHVQEYRAPDSIDPDKAKQRLDIVMDALPAALDIPKRNVFLKERQKQKGESQYQKQQSTGKLHEVTENGLRFLVNFTDYLDTGIFLDHRRTRQLIAEISTGKRFLNLFAYTGTATVYAASGRAKSTVSVDLSKHYLSWAEKNMALNGFGTSQHRFVQDDVSTWLRQQNETYDVIFVDPPTFSNSKKLKHTFDIQKGYITLIQSASRILSKHGILIFSNNYRQFKFNETLFPGLTIKNITSQTMSPDFARSPKIHNCWRITHKN